MQYNSDVHHRRSIRLKNYDYCLPNAYFVTICAKNHECLFGDIVSGKMFLSDAGKIIDKQWRELENRFHNI